MSALTALKNRIPRRGSILVLTLFFMMVLFLLAEAFWSIIPYELHSARRYKDDTQAYFAADAGVVDTLAWLSKKTADGNVDQFFVDSGNTDDKGNKVYYRDGNIDDWKWRVTITPGPQTQGNTEFPGQNAIRVYKIDSVAYLGNSWTDTNKATFRSISAWITQDSFAGTNWGVAEGANGSDLWLNLDTFKLGGDFHTNDQLRLAVPNKAFWDRTGSAVGGKLTFAKDSSGNSQDHVEYRSSNQDLLPYNKSNGSSISDRYEKITTLGRNGIQVVDRIPLPPNSDSVAAGVWGESTLPTSLSMTDSVFGADSGRGNSVRAYLHTKNGKVAPGASAPNGIYIDGAINQIQMGLVDQNGANVTNRNASNYGTANQRISINQSGNRQLQVTFVTGEFTIPAGETINGQTAQPAQTYRGTDNGGEGTTVFYDPNKDEYMTFKGQTNGAIYSTGDIRGIRGTTKGRRTIATSTDTGNSNTALDHEISITGELTYASTVPGQTPTTSTDQLGLIGYAVRMEASEASSAPLPGNNNGSLRDGLMWPRRSTTSKTTPYYLYCSIFAGRENDPMKNSGVSTKTGQTQGGGFGTESYDTVNQGYMALFGSITEGIRQAKGTFNDDGSGTGIAYQFFLDPNLKTVQPPFFPSLPRYQVISWEEKSVFAY